MTHGEAPTYSRCAEATLIGIAAGWSASLNRCGGETTETRVKLTKVGDKTELIKREGASVEADKTMAAEVILDALLTYTAA